MVRTRDAVTSEFGVVVPMLCMTMHVILETWEAMPLSCSWTSSSLQTWRGSTDWPPGTHMGDLHSFRIVTFARPNFSCSRLVNGVLSPSLPPKLKKKIKIFSDVVFLDPN